MWRDDDRDGTRDPGELGLPGWLVTVNSGPVQSWTLLGEQTLTDAAGRYQFVGLAPGVYVVTVNDQQRHWPTTSCQVKVLTSGVYAVQADFGFYAAPVMVYLPLLRWR